MNGYENDTVPQVGAEESGDDSEDEKTPVQEDSTQNMSEEEIFKMIEANDKALRTIKAQEEKLRSQVTEAEAKARKATTDMRIEKRHHDDETLARRIQSGEVNMDEVFADDAIMHRFVRYQLFVQRKNEEFARKRGHAFGTVVLERLYLNMFSAWRMAKKRAVVVAEEDVARIHYEGVKTIAPENSTIR